MNAHETEPHTAPGVPLPGAGGSRSAGAVPDEFAFLRGLIAGLRCGILILDAGGRIVLLNDHARRILDLDGPPALGATVDDVLARYPGLTRMLLGASGMASLPDRAELDLGRGRRIGFTLSPVAGAEGDVAGVAMFFKDLTQIEHTEEQERLKDRLAALGQMAANVAHEIRNPLASIEVTSKLLWRRLADDPSCRDLLAKITSEVKRLNSAVDSCLRFVKPIRPSFRRAELGPLLEEALAVASERQRHEGIGVRTRISPGIPPFRMDPDLLRQVFVNLIVNAFEALDGGGTVTIEAERIAAPPAASVPYRPREAPADAGQPPARVEHFVVVRVSDTGPGIEEEDRDRVFYPFFTTKEQGSGVGLALSKKIVGSHDGLIGIDRAPSGGAVFQVRLPVIQEAAEV